MCWNKGRLCWKIAKLFYFCHLKKLVRPETFWTLLRIGKFYENLQIRNFKKIRPLGFALFRAYRQMKWYDGTSCRSSPCGSAWNLALNTKRDFGHRDGLMPGFCREAAENGTLLGYYATSSSNLLPTFRHNLSVPSSGILEPWIWDR